MKFVEQTFTYPLFIYLLFKYILIISLTSFVSLKNSVRLLYST